MKAFQISLNGEPFVTAGIGESGVLSAIANWVTIKGRHPAKDEFFMNVGGLDDATGEYVRWSAPEIKLGDEIHIKFIETDQVTPTDFRGMRGEFEQDAAERAAADDDAAEAPDGDENVESM